MQHNRRFEGQLTLLEATNVFVRGLAIIIVAVVAERALGAVDLAWDVISYHLPFIGLRMGFITFDDYGLGPGLKLYFDGFPSLLDYVRGFIWLGTGRPEAMNLLGLASVITLCLYLRLTWKVSASWAFVAFMAIPAVHTAISSNYTDVVSNVALTVLVLCFCEVLVRETVLVSRGFWFRLGLAALVAGNSKLHISFITALVVGLLFFTLVVKIWRSRHSAGLVGWPQMFAIIAVGIASSYTMIGNIWLFGNPVYPVAVTIGPWSLNGPYKGGESYFPTYLIGVPQGLRWLVSVIEYRALELRIPTYSQGMGEVPEGIPSSRMGGFLGMFAVFSLLLLVKTAVLDRRDHGPRLFTVFLAISVVCANLPSSHESRYYLTWMLLLVALVFIRLTTVRDSSLEFSFRSSVIAAFIFVSSVTGGAYFTAPLRTDTYLTETYAEFLKTLPPGVEICAKDNVRMAVMASRLFQPQSTHRVETGTCSEGSVVLP